MITNEGQEVGVVSKTWSGLGREMFTSADTFGVKFPKDLCVKMKCVLIAAVFQIVSFGNYLLSINPNILFITTNIFFTSKVM